MSASRCMDGLDSTVFVGLVYSGICRQSILHLAAMLMPRMCTLQSALPSHRIGNATSSSCLQWVQTCAIGIGQCLGYTLPYTSTGAAARSKQTAPNILHAAR